MLEQLSIKNYALIEDLNLSFHESLNIFTGETGAGKSIIIGAFNLVLGERASTSVIRQGAESCVIRAIFDIGKNKSLKNLLKEQSLTVEDNSLLLSREINTSGKSKCLVNGQPVTLGMLGTIGSHLVDLHGQHEHQAILRTREQMNILDDFGDLLSLRSEVEVAFEEYLRLKTEWEQLQQDEQERIHQIDLYQFQLKEIKDAHLEPEEEEKLDKEINLLNNAEKIFALVFEIYQNLYEEEGAALSRINKINKNLENLQGIDPDFEKTNKLLQDCRITLEEINAQIRDYKEKIEFNPQKLDQLLERKELIAKLKHKYGTPMASIGAILEYQIKIQKELDKLIHWQENKETMIEQIKVAKEKLLKLAQKLSQDREKIATKLETQAEQELKTLGLPKIRFKINLTKTFQQDGESKITGEGLETVEFLISPNVGEELKPLAQIASGGEMSRIMLGLKTVLAASDKICTLVFDEIDTGIGGSMAEVVGKKLAALSRNHQVVCITHWPQIAGFAQLHLQVTKAVKHGRTQTLVKELEGRERIEELAHMLGGEKLTEISLKHAQEMVKGTINS